MPLPPRSRVPPQRRPPALPAWQRAEGSVPPTGGQRHLRASAEAVPRPGRGWTPPWTPPTESRARSRPAPWPHPVTAWRAALARGFSLLQRGLALGAGAGRSESPRALQTRLLLGLRGQRGWGLPSHRKLSSRSRVASWRRRRRLASRSWVYLRMRVSPFFLFKK